VEELMADHRAQQPILASVIVGAEHEIMQDERDSEDGACNQMDLDIQPDQNGEQLDPNQDMDIDMMMGHYEYQNFTDQLIDKNHSEMIEEAINYFKIQSDGQVPAGKSQKKGHIAPDTLGNDKTDKNTTQRLDNPKSQELVQKLLKEQQN